MTTNETGAEARLRSLGLRLPDAPRPLGAYVPAVQTGNLLFLSGMLAIQDGRVPVAGHLGQDLGVQAGREAARTAALNALALIRRELGSLDRVRRVVRLGVMLAATPAFAEHAKVADGASELLRDVFGEARVSTRLVMGVASLPLGSPVELEVIVEASP